MHEVTDTPEAPPGAAADELAERYTWEIVHDGVTVDSGESRLGEPHPLTGSTAGQYYEVACGLFEQACDTVVEEHRYEVMMARVDGNPEPRPVTVVTVLLRYADGSVAISMTAHPRHRPITDKDMTEYREYLEWAEEDHRRFLQRKALTDETFDLPWESTEEEWVPDETIDQTDPRLTRIAELEGEAADIRAEVFDPDHCRELRFRAEEKLRAAHAAAVEAEAGGDDAALAAAEREVLRRTERLARWTTLLAETTAAYLQAAALDAEAAQVRRAIQADNQEAEAGSVSEGE
ncbi:hypothetical protein [Nocardia suismassiliense]|uniref:hypothetical protein n=1 Tax=Nocardia suismassiliense TaxID=2077092 RepID=UPI000D1EF613|nr:hypothetical protein [Nocardia suismassiliense]